MRKRLFGRDDDGRAVEEVVLESGEAAVSILSLGCVVRDWRIDGPRGSLPMVLGFPRARGLPAPLPLARRHRRPGREPHRGRALHPRRQEYVLDANEGPNHLHGGAGRARQADLGHGDRQRGQHGASSSTAAPTARRAIPATSPSPSRFRLEGPRLICEMAGMPDRPTPISLANHNYYNLGGGGHGEGPPALGGRAATTPRPTPS